MTAALPLHYALTEAIVAAAGVIGIGQLMAISRSAALGLAPFALAGLIGAIQIAGGLTGPIVMVHAFLSRAGAVFGLGCLVAVLAHRRAPQPAAIGAAAAAAVIAFPAAGVAIFVVLILGGAVLTFRAAPHRRVMAAVGFALLLPAQQLTAALRPAHPAMAWHLFHVLVALWLVGIAAIFQRARLQRAT
ncbi:hypothetical protein [Sphingomonas sp. 28-63-12]|uniref:hypothetical protein n=1 Tax=Sphingomonas sp. 28-63-12 TaxID=1970434 RepID=UPI000BD8B93E|nr:MAG: hypothetical protein B7Y47_05920 [Sphingomonas sp. 28-63-12]